MKVKDIVIIVFTLAIGTKESDIVKEVHYSIPCFHQITKLWKLK